MGCEESGIVCDEGARSGFSIISGVIAAPLEDVDEEVRHATLKTLGPLGEQAAITSPSRAAITVFLH